MLIGDFDELLFATPFQPFVVATTDGRSLYVKGPEYAWHPPEALRLVWIVKEDPSAAALVDLKHVSQLVVGERPTPRPRQRRRRSSS